MAFHDFWARRREQPISFNNLPIPPHLKVHIEDRLNAVDVQVDNSHLLVEFVATFQGPIMALEA